MWPADVQEAETTTWKEVPGNLISGSIRRTESEAERSGWKSMTHACTSMIFPEIPSSRIQRINPLCLNMFRKVTEIRTGKARTQKLTWNILRRFRRLKGSFRGACIFTPETAWRRLTERSAMYSSSEATTATSL